jgi:hypothetical protein
VFKDQQRIRRHHNCRDIDISTLRGQVLPLFSLLCHFYLGQTYEATGKNQQAIDEYQSFLAHFEGSRLRFNSLASHIMRLQ